MGCVLLSTSAVIVHRRLGMRTEWYGVGQVAQSHAYGMGVPVAELHQAGEAQRILVAGPRPIQVLVIELNLLKHEFKQPSLPFIQILDNARANPHALFNRLYLPSRPCRQQRLL
jgi:hypothetical protein